MVTLTRAMLVLALLCGGCSDDDEKTDTGPSGNDSSIDMKVQMDTGGADKSTTQDDATADQSSADPCANLPTKADQFCCYVEKTCKAGTPSDDNISLADCKTNVLKGNEPTDPQVACVKAHADKGSGGCCMLSKQCYP